MSSGRRALPLDQYPADWERIPISGLGEVHNGTTPSRSEPSFWGGSTSWVTPSEITALKDKWLCDTEDHVTTAGLSSSSLKVLPPNTVLVTTRATVGEAAISTVPVTTNQGFKSVDPNEDTNSLFAYYLLRHTAPEMRRLAKGTTFDEISMGDFSAIAVARPPLTEQHRIAEILDTVDEAIRQSEAVIAKLEEMKKGLLHDLLTRGLDENGELRDPLANPEQFKDSPLGRIPREWEVLQAGEIGEIVTGSTPKRSVSRYWHGDVPWLTPTDLSDLSTEWVEEGKENITRQGLSSCAAALMPAGTLLITSRATIGLCAIAAQPVSTNQGFKNLVPNAGFHPLYLYYLLGLAIPRMVQLASGSTFSEISKTNFESIQMAIAPKAEQERIMRKAVAFQQRFRSERLSVAKLRSLKNALMQDLLTGRVRVPVPKDSDTEVSA